MKYIVFTLLTLVFSTAYAQIAAQPYVTKVAIIDTGFSGFYATELASKSLCKTGHYDFTVDKPILGYDTIGHGTFVTNLIVENAKRDDICILMYKVDAYVREETRDHIGKALVKAYKAGARMVNISMGHPHYSHKEARLFEKAARKGMVVFASAGNDGKDLNQMCKVYPACYASVQRNLFRVGSIDRSGLIETYSNRGSLVHIYEYGSIERVGRGTSFASPRALARYLREKTK